MLATWITLARFPLLLGAILCFSANILAIRLVGVGVLLVGLLLDTVDGVVARQRRETSLLGSVLDIAADRAYEIVVWFDLAHRGLIPIFIPLIVVIRTVLTDGIRSVGVTRGRAPLEQVDTRIARLLVRSAWFRIGYGLSKVVGFCGLALVGALGREAPGLLVAIATAAAWVCAGLCVLRGIPVMVQGFREQGLGWRRQSNATPVP